MSTPLSDLMDAVQADAPGAFERFLSELARAPVGIQADQRPDGSLAVRTGGHPQMDGEWILVFADPPAFVARFGARFNAEVQGRGAFEIVEANAHARGVLVNSATSAISVQIPRDVALRALGRPAKPWWRFW